LARIDPRNHAHYWRAPGIPGLSCLLADFTTHDYAPHSHDALVIAVTEAGGAEFRSRGQTHEASASFLLAFNPDEPHSGRMARSERWRYRGLYLTAPAIDAVKQALGLASTPHFTRNLFADQDLIAGFQGLHDALEDGRDALRERELLIGCLGTLVRRHAAGGARMPAAPQDRSRIERLRALMRARFAEELTLEILGAAVGLTPFQLIALFKRTIGLTPHAYLTQLRLEAATLEMASGASLAAAAAAAGFYDQSAMTKHFKRCHGITPLQWTRAARA
jgi:AraC-like DNA-binding protein